ncbi:MAG: prephenate dehydrogenase/arogenate dehydrogenase family protein [Pseudomonadales bacterium]|nr:prephenate dehydrogenase/arogenate dehydrogenase family protein [Pseudomonadales bacterium]NIX06562.1 prephenate dehydrogenase/arogenate dehydrogenase family protein [Pseudomonadales bacterium]
MLLTVVGTGLIGGSFALGARTRNLFQSFVGVDPDADNARSALSLGIVDEIAEEVPPASDAVLIAAPSDAVAGWVTRLADHPGVLFDAGSVKGAILDGISDQLGAVPERFVPCHPIAGRELSGPGAANEDLFADRLVVQTPLAGTDPEAREQVAYWWRSLGARVESMDPELHDRVYALTSHLPHLIAFAYMQQIEPAHLDHAGGGFRDFSRIGGSDPDMWSAIFGLNKEAVLGALAGFEADLAGLREAIEAEDQDAVRAYIARASGRRRGYLGD